MAGDRKRMSKVFVGHPWNEKPESGKFPQEEFRRILYELPIIPDFGNTTPRAGTLGTLLNHLKSQMGKAEYCLFDLTDLNPNVTFELGIADGLGKKLKGLFMLLNTDRTKVEKLPSDLRGVLGLIKYRSYDYKPHGLGDELVTHVLASEHWFRAIWKHVPKAGKERKRLILALRLLGHMRDHKSIDLSEDQARAKLLPAKGLRLDKSDWQATLNMLRQKGLLRKHPKRRDVYVLNRNQFRTR